MRTLVEIKALYSKKTSKDLLLDILSLLRAMHWNYYTSHWQAKGENFYGNHLLFQRLYERIPGEIDDLAEKLVSYFGEDSIKQLDVIGLTMKWTSKWIEKDDVIRAKTSEEDLQKLIQTTYDTLKDSDEMSLGLDDFLMNLANNHETHLYLLGRIK